MNPHFRTARVAELLHKDVWERTRQSCVIKGTGPPSTDTGQESANRLCRKHLCTPRSGRAVLRFVLRRACRNRFVLDVNGGVRSREGLTGVDVGLLDRLAYCRVDQRDVGRLHTARQ